jgi:hypothetical protein
LTGEPWERRVPDNNIERLLTPAEAAEILRVAESTLRGWRTRGTGPPWLKIGRSVRYSRSGLVEWMNAQERGGG